MTIPTVQSNIFDYMNIQQGANGLCIINKSLTRCLVKLHVKQCAIRFISRLSAAYGSYQYSGQVVQPLSHIIADLHRAIALKIDADA